MTELAAAVENVFVVRLGVAEAVGTLRRHDLVLLRVQDGHIKLAVLGGRLRAILLAPFLLLLGLGLRLHFGVVRQGRVSVVFLFGRNDFVDVLGSHAKEDLAAARLPVHGLVGAFRCFSFGFRVSVRVGLREDGRTDALVLSALSGKS